MPIDISGLDATELEALIMRAAQRRAQVVPAVPNKLPSYTYGIHNPQWFISTQNGELRLHLRDPGTGWLTFVLPPSEALNMGKVLVKSAEEMTSFSPPSAPAD